MSLHWCESCQQLEGPTHQDPDGVTKCDYCDEEIQNIPEHDDYDLER